MERRATLRALISGTPAPSSVPSIRQKRDMAYCATRDPTVGTRRMYPSHARRPADETNQLRTRNALIPTPKAASTP